MYVCGTIINHQDVTQVGLIWSSGLSSGKWTLNFSQKKIAWTGKVFGHLRWTTPNFKHCSR